MSGSGITCAAKTSEGLAMTSENDMLTLLLYTCQGLIFLSKG